MDIVTRAKPQKRGTIEQFLSDGDDDDHDKDQNYVNDIGEMTNTHHLVRNLHRLVIIPVMILTWHRNLIKNFCLLW